jgi:NADPH-dependent 2,4-dienoyl-CoA reductase/sulfur reductase-like enzyme
VILADEDFLLGGRLNSETHALGDTSGSDWAKATLAELVSLPNVRVMSRTTIFGAMDHGIYGALERVSDHLREPAPDKPRQTFWRIYTKRSLLCAGATERPIAFQNNDRPGIMLGSALRSYVNRWAASPAHSRLRLV